MPMSYITRQHELCVWCLLLACTMPMCWKCEQVSGSTEKDDVEKTLSGRNTLNWLDHSTLIFSRSSCFSTIRRWCLCCAASFHRRSSCDSSARDYTSWVNVELSRAYDSIHRQTKIHGIMLIYYLWPIFSLSWLDVDGTLCSLLFCYSFG